MYPFFHPLSSLIVAVTFIAIYFIGLFAKSFLNRGNSLAIPQKSYLSLVFGIFELGILLLWIHRFEIYQSNIKGLWQNIFSRAGEVLGNMGNALSKVNVHGLDLVTLYIKLYGADTILIILSLIALILIFRRIKRADHDSFPFFIVYIGVLFLIFGAIYLLYLAGLLGLGSIGADRMIYYTMLFTPELAAIAIFWISQKLKYNLLKFILIVALLAIPSGLSLRGLYYSPYNVQPNAQVTAKDMVGYEWMITEKDLKIGILNIVSEPPRFFDAILGSTATSQREDRYDVQFLDHFGYQKYSTLGTEYPVDQYAVIVASDKVVYSTVWKNVGRFSDSDFIKLANDNTVSELYSNGGTDVFYVKTVTK